MDFLFDIELQNFTQDVLNAGTYKLSLDGVDIVTGVVVSGATNGVVFTPAAPVEVSAGVHTWTLTCSSSVTWYRQNASSTGPIMSGTGRYYVGKWNLIASSSDSMPGTFNFKSLDGGLVATVYQTTASSGSFTSQTGNHVFSSPVFLVAVRSANRDADTYDLVVDGVVKASATAAGAVSGEDFVYRPSTPVSLSAASHSIAIDGTASRRYQYCAGTSTAETGDGASHISAWGVWAESTGNQPQRTLAFIVDLSIPDPPINLAEDHTHEEATLTWDPPAGGDYTESYEVRIDGGTPVDVGLAETYTWDSLAPSTTYLLEVRGIGGDGASSWVSIESSTDASPGPEEVPPLWYHVDLTVGPYSWSIEYGDTPAFGPRLPLSLGWSIPDSVAYFPAQADPTTMAFQLLVESANDIADLEKGSAVSFAMWVELEAYEDEDDPWQTFQGIITQLDGTNLPGQGFLATVYGADDIMRLATIMVGWTEDWPVESIETRLFRIIDEAGVNGPSYPGPLGVGMEGWLRERDLTSGPIDALSAIRETVKDLAFDNDSEGGGVHYYGRPALRYLGPPYEELLVYAFERRVYPDSTDTLDGSLVYAAGSWTKRPGTVAASWVLVDGTMFGFPPSDAGGTPPIVWSTSLLDYTGDPPGSSPNYSAVTRDNLGEALLAAESELLAGWYHNSLRYDAYRDPYKVTQWASYAPPIQVQPVVIEDIQYELNDVDYLAGTLTGARLVIPPGGEYYLELRLRPELLDGTDLPAP
jgi:hypothetical protein